MTYIHIKEVWTPLRLFGIRIYRDVDTKKWYIKKGKNKRMRSLR